MANKHFVHLQFGLDLACEGIAEVIPDCPEEEPAPSLGNCELASYATTINLDQVTCPLCRASEMFRELSPAPVAGLMKAA
jgi:hypothetical protein